MHTLNSFFPKSLQQPVVHFNVVIDTRLKKKQSVSDRELPRSIFTNYYYYPVLFFLLCIYSYHQVFCLCPDGYSLASDWKTCKDNDECLEEDNGGCDQMCVNTPGGHQCECHVGFRKIKVEGSCQDVNECQDIPALCGHGDCVNLPGTYLCECHSGFRLDDGTCEDIDECKNHLVLTFPLISRFFIFFLNFREINFTIFFYCLIFFLLFLFAK